jgi:hypothetical protein
MSLVGQRRDPAPMRRRYLVQLFCVLDRDCESGRYVARIRPWAARSGVNAKTCERAFADECELIATINPLLPPGSDIRDVFDHIESPNGFFYLLHLSSEQAGELGWRRELSSGEQG